jgi:hypothetical protein
MVPPGANECAPPFARYVSLAADIADPLSELTVQQARVVARLSPLGEDRAGYRYAPDKWSVKELVNHLSDAERVFAYRLLRIGRGDPTPLPGFEENDYAQAAQSDRRPFTDILHEWTMVRGATTTLAASLQQPDWANIGTTNRAPMSARALLYVVLGHTEHHLAVLRDRYGI